ncbi:ABC transporter substrate-binding protein [Streptomyces sp. NPDC058335]|uniref:ABC transporter substrate-binding protein n=1 Tax=Streptomyces sp. NPDC058335 TaxID=3346451 RepID=UPI003650105A
MTTHRRTMAAVAALIAVASFAGCTRSPGDAKGKADSDLGQKVASSDIKCGLSNGKKAAGKPIKVGAISTMSNGVDFSSSPLAAKAYFDCVNANGGINGRPVDYDSQDDALDPQKGSALATQFAENKDVVAMVGDASFVSCGIEQPIYAAADLYSITGVGVPRSCFFSKNIAPVNGGPRLSMVSQAKFLVDEYGATSISTQVTGLPDLGDWLVQGLKDYARDAGIAVPLGEPAPVPVKDANSVAVSIGKSGTDAFIAGFPGPDNASVLKAALQQGLQDKVRFGCLTSCYDSTFPSQIGDGWNGKFTTNSEFTLLNAKTPDNLNWRAVISKYGEPDQVRDSFSQAGYVAARILVDTLMSLDPNDITRKSVSKAVVGIKDFKTDMMCTPWYFGDSDHHNANHQLHNVKLDGDGNFVPGADCFETPDPELADVLAQEKADPSLIGK